MKQRNWISGGVVSLLAIGWPGWAVAQGPQTLGQCIRDLNQQGFYTQDAADRCEQALRRQPPAETLGQCITQLRQQRFFVAEASDRCQRLLAHQGDRDPATVVTFPSYNASSTLGQCIRDLQRQGFYTDQAADRCEQVLRQQPRTETLSSCIANLRQTGLFTETAARRCEQLLAAQRSPHPPLWYSVPLAGHLNEPGYGTVEACMRRVMYRRVPVCAVGPNPADATCLSGGVIRDEWVSTGISQLAAQQICLPR